MPQTAAPGPAPEGAGSLELIVGPMFSGKSSDLIQRVRVAAHAGLACALVKHRGDVRYAAGPVLATHDEGRQASAAATALRGPIRVVEAAALGEVALGPEELVVGVDEGQFFPDLVAVCDRWAGEGRRVVVAALDSDFARGPFAEVGALLARCEAVDKRSGVCMDCRSRRSAFTRRLPGAEEGAGRILVAGHDRYRAVCRRCHAAAQGAERQGPRGAQEAPAARPGEP